MCVASSVLVHAMKCAIFENLSTTIRIQSRPFLDLGNLRIKSIEMLVQGS
uniref:Uncharacterized protein n=1 Tax=Rhizophora mucronata TaxID=61149 RepID=A0A2P2Q1X2_RHIMU